MPKQYYIKKDPQIDGPKVEWIAINGKEFYQLITSSAGKGRYFIDMDEFMIESTEAEYKDWRREKDHSDYKIKIFSAIFFAVSTEIPLEVSTPI